MGVRHVRSEVRKGRSGESRLYVAYRRVRGVRRCVLGDRAEGFRTSDAGVGDALLYLTSDLHLGHANIIGYTYRPFHSVGEMNDTLIGNIAATVSVADTLYVLGDFAFDPRVFETYMGALESLCNVVFLQGNHDPKKWRHTRLLAWDFKYNKRHYYLCHYRGQRGGRTR